MSLDPSLVSRTWDRQWCMQRLEVERVSASVRHGWKSMWFVRFKTGRSTELEQ